MRDRFLLRRAFLKSAAYLPTAGLICPLEGSWSGGPFPFTAPSAEDYSRELLRTAAPARFWTGVDSPSGDCGVCHETAVEPGDHRHESRYVRCGLCARECMLAEGERGFCRARVNDEGTLRSLVYGRPVAVHLDPIEKKPFYHFLPGVQAFSLATTGCPLRCEFCQNWELSQARPEDYEVPYIPPKTVAGAAGERKAPVIAFTYNEPTVFAEYLLDIAAEARRRKISSVMVSCGFMNERPLAEMCEALQAIKIDLKGFDESFYRDVCGAELQPVLRTIKQIARAGVHLEIVNLVVPTLNDSETMLRDLARWVAGEVGPDVPVHFTRFHPDYRLRNLPPTPVSTLDRAYRIAKEEGLRYPFVGNVPGHPGNHTYCPRCGKAVIERSGFFVTKDLIKDGRCPECGEAIAGVWSAPFR